MESTISPIETRNLLEPVLHAHLSGERNPGSPELNPKLHREVVRFALKAHYLPFDTECREAIRTR